MFCFNCSKNNRLHVKVYDFCVPLYGCETWPLASTEEHRFIEQTARRNNLQAIIKISTPMKTSKISNWILIRISESEACKHQENGRNFTVRRFIMYTPYQKLLGGKWENVIGEVCSTHKKDEKFVQNFKGKPNEKTPLWTTRFKHNIKMDTKETEEGVDWIKRIILLDTYVW